ncbi:MAG: hypothetical protein ACOZNI_12325 [Myxococcota bacterium]
MLFGLLACDPFDHEAQDAEIAALRAEVAALREALDARDTPATYTPYTDAQAVAAVQNADPFTNDDPNLRSLWSNTEGGIWWLNEAQWYGDNRHDPPGRLPTSELVELYHETAECGATSAFSDCDATGGIKLYANGPRITDNDWSAAGYAAAATRAYHTHASGMYLVSFGQYATVTDYGQLIPPSGIHLEPHGAHQGLRVDGTGNAGDNVRIDLAMGGTGLAVYTSPDTALYCQELGRDCADAYPLYLRGGTLHLEDLAFERSVDDHRGSGAFTAGAASLGVRRLVEYSWAEAGMYAWCVYNTKVTAESLVFVRPYGVHARAFDARLLDTWGPGEAPDACVGTQLVTTSAGTYGYGVPDDATAALPGFRVVLVDADGPMDPAVFVEDHPVVSYEVVEPI